MPWGAVAGAAIAAAGSIGSGVMGSNAAGNAANQQAAASQAATTQETNMYNETVARELPFVTSGQNALTQLQSLLGVGPGGTGQPTSPILQMLGIGGTGGTGAGSINPATFQGSPGYQYQLQQGLGAVTNANAPTGIGGNALRALQQTGQGLANQNWSNYIGSAGTAWQQLLANISNLVGIGQNAAGNLGNTATQVGSQIAGNTIGAGNALAAGTIGSANALAGGIGGAVNNSLPYLLSNQSGGGVGPITGIGNLFSGYNWNGTPNSSTMAGLSDQAATNVSLGGPY